MTQSKGEIYIGVIGKRATFWPGLPWWPMGEGAFQAIINCQPANPQQLYVSTCRPRLTTSKRLAVASVTGRWRLPAQDFTELSQSMKATARLLFALHLAFDEVLRSRRRHCLAVKQDPERSCWRACSLSHVIQFQAHSAAAPGLR